MYYLFSQLVIHFIIYTFEHYYDNLQRFKLAYRITSFINRNTALAKQ